MKKRIALLMIPLLLLLAMVLLAMVLWGPKDEMKKSAEKPAAAAGWKGG